MDDERALEPGDEPRITGELTPSLDEQVAAWQEKNADRYRRLREQSRAVYRAMDGWADIKTDEDWVRRWLTAREEYRSGRFLLDRLGAERLLDPTLMATLWSLRQELIEDLEATKAHEVMLVDAAVLAFYHLLRFNGWVGNLSLLVESEFFGVETLSTRQRRATRLSSTYGPEQLRVEDHVQRIGEQLLPFMDRAQRMMLRAIRELRRPPAPSVAIGRAGQVNVGTLQQNTAQTGAADGAHGARRRRARNGRTLPAPDSDNEDSESGPGRSTRGKR
jgi:hypothetical protein